MVKRIFIFGCARSGTTLLLNLFRCFKDTLVVDGQHPVDEFEDYSDDRRHVVLKRTPACATDLTEKIVRDGDIWVVDINRDPRDVVTSIMPGRDNYYTDFTRWERDIKAIEELSQVYSKLMRIKFEDLLLKSHAIQGTISSQLGLTTRYAFGEFSEVLQEGDISPSSVSVLGGIRPLDKNNLGRWKNNRNDIRRVLDQIDKFPQIPEYLVKYDYERDRDWMRQYL